MFHGEKTSDSKGLVNLGNKGSTGWKLNLDKFGLKIRYKFLTVRAIKHQNNLSMDLVDSLPFEILKLKLSVFLKELH